MYIIKQNYEDFQVEEIPNYKTGQGDYAYFWLEKTGLNTSEAIKLVARALHISYKRIGYAGNKDKRAITKQVCSVRDVKKENLENLKLKNVVIIYLGQNNKPISLGDLKGNRFTITIKNITKKIKPIKKIINLFDEQRFSTDNIEIGKSIVKGNFQKTTQLLLKNNLVKNKIKAHLKQKPKDYVNAIKLVDKKLLMLFVHAYQSYIWNECVKKLQTRTKNFPIVGFGTETNNKIIKEILKKEELTFRDFIIRQIPEISAEGTDRTIKVEVKNFKIVKQTKDTATISFELPKGSYATQVVKQLLE